MASLYVRKVPPDELPTPRPLRPEQRIPIGQVPLTIGRDKRRSDCWLPEHTVSKLHARITPNGGNFLVEDLDSHNHTYLNDSRLEPRRPAELSHGDEIRICGYVFKFQEHDSDQSNVQTTVEASISPAPYSQFLETQPSDKLRVLLTLGGVLNKTLDPWALMDRVADELFELFRQADRCLIIQREADTDMLIPVVARVRQPARVCEPFSQTIVRNCMETLESFLSEDVTQMPELEDNDSVASATMRSVMCVPLPVQERAVGVIQLDSSDRGRKFTKDDLEFLLCVANQAAFAMEFVQLHQAVLEQEKLADDMRRAHEVQRGLLPRHFPEVPGYEFFAHYAPARSVGGDYYDFVPLDDGRHAVLLGDVSGKGLPAALLMARMSGAAQLCLSSGCDLPQAIHAMNAQLLRADLGDRYVTLAATLLDPVQHRVTVVNAGHLTPWVYRKATRALEEAIPEERGGVPIGVLLDASYQSVNVELSAGDSIILYSDGILDAGLSAGRRFGEARLREALKTAPGERPLTPRQIGERIKRAVETHAAGCEQFDDIALVCYGRAE
jgi:phosphoserine phosphatase RsbU/P